MRRFATIIIGVAVLGSLALAAPALAQAPEPPVGGEVTLVDAGQEPRQLLRYELAEGASETTRIDMDMTMSMAMSGVEAMAMTLPMSMTMSSTVSSVSPEGVARVEFELTDFDFGDIAGTVEGAPVDGAGLGALDPALTGLLGASGWMLVDDRGRVLDAGLDVTDGFPQDMVPQSQQTATQTRPLPEEPVGVGARWEASMSVDQAGLGMDVLVTTEIVEMTDAGFVTEETFSLDASSSGGLMDELVPGMELAIDEYAVEGSGRTEFELDRLSQDGVMEMLMRMAMSAAFEGESMDMTMDMAMTMTSTVTD